MKTIAILAVLLSVVSAKKLTLRSAKATIEAGKPCDQLKCPPAWRLKPNHHTLTGATAADCCDKTCELFSCVGAYRSNEAYWGNVGSSPQICCDMMCGKNFECDVGYVLGDATAPGISKKDCCQPKCELFNCTAPYAPSAAKKDVVSSKAEDCCELTCAAFNCSIPGWAPNKTQETEIGQSAEECCTPLCGNSAQVTCKAGFAVKEENVNKTSADIDEGCCAATCESWTCSDGLAPNPDKETAFAASDEECCLPTCKKFECSIEKGWAPWPAVADDIGDNATKCCLPTCKQFECGEGFLPYPEGEKDNVTSQSNTACCLPACESYSCSAAKGLMKIPNAKKVGGDDDKACCESSKCEKVRKNMTALEDKKFCNGLDKEECVTKYTKSESGAIVMCTFNETYDLCRYDVDAAISGGCTDV